jgi:hypothetical protein
MITAIPRFERGPVVVVGFGVRIIFSMRALGVKIIPRTALGRDYGRTFKAIWLIVYASGTSAEDHSSKLGI